MIPVIVFLAYLTWVNLATYRAFAFDKRAAIEKQQRTPEATLLWWASIGGWAGAKYAQNKLRHKSSKQPFGSELNNIGVIQGLVAGTLMLTLGYLGLAPTGQPLMSAKAAAATVQPAPAELAVSLRPPAGRLSGQ